MSLADLDKWDADAIHAVFSAVTDHSELNDFSMAWSAEPGIDLTEGPAVPVRAHMESYLLAWVTGDDRYLYPGFAKAVDPNQPFTTPAGQDSL
jgi:hypothetical protein